MKLLMYLTIVDLGDDTMNKYKYNAANALKSYIERKKKQNYSDMMEQAKKDKNFEAMIQDMTIGAIAGKSKLEKNKYRY